MASAPPRRSSSSAAIRYVVTSGGPASGRWEENPLSYAEMADRELIRSGVPKDKNNRRSIQSGLKVRRTYESAVAVSHALQARNIQPKALNVFTLGPHARRSRLVFAKVEGPQTKVGVVAWTPTDYRIGAMVAVLRTGQGLYF